MKASLKVIITVIILVIGLGDCAGNVLAEPRTYGNAVVERITSVYDGDTFHCDIAGWPPIIGQRIGVRINGIDTPEMRDRRPKIRELARQAKMFTVQALRSAKRIELRDMKRGKYFRIVADVFVDGRSLADMLIETGLAKPYGGGKKPGW